MSSYKLILTFATFALLISHSFQCIHDEMEHPEIEFAPHSEIDPATAADPHRRLSEWGAIRIAADSFHLDGNVTTDPYIKSQLIPTAIEFFTKTLKVPTLEGVFISENRTSICGLDTPSYLLNTTVDADLIILFAGEYDKLNWIASASACVLVTPTNRPVIARVTFNYNYVFPSNAGNYESHLVTTIHEITHALGFSYTLYDKFANPVTFKSTVVNSVTTFYLDAPILTQKVRDYFGCPNAIGAYMEQQGSGGSVGSHFERRIFHNEYMTASAQKDMRITQFALALLEDSGWYQVDYSLTEPIYFGKGQGCGFLNGPCATNGVGNYKGYCSAITQYDCTFHRKIGGYCGHLANVTNKNLKPSWNYWGDNRTVDDSFADNCPTVNQLRAIDCEDPASIARRIVAGETYAPGSKCFMGNIYPSVAFKRDFQYCVKYNCELQSNGTYFVNLFVGSAKAVCYGQKTVSVKGYAGVLQCPDPQDFCTTVGIQFCKRGCFGRGTCQADGSCLCNPGFYGSDCSLTSPL